MAIVFEDRAYGRVEMPEGVFTDLVRTRALQRLREIGQHGAWQYIRPQIRVSRFEHSVGVFFLLRWLGAPEEEQAAGLLHDINHTAFSHVIDYVMGQPKQQAYHEGLTNPYSGELDSILSSAGMSGIMETDGFGLLEREIPDLCADRLDYFFRDSVALGICSRADIEEFLDHMVVFRDEIMMDDRSVAQRMGEAFLDCSRTFWASPTQIASYHILSEAVKRSIDRGYVSAEDFFLTDQLLYEKMSNSGDREVVALLNLLKPSLKVSEVEDGGDIKAATKARYIDPKIIIGDLDSGEVNVKRLSALVPVYKQRMVTAVSRMSKEHNIRIDIY